VKAVSLRQPHASQGFFDLPQEIEVGNQRAPILVINCRFVTCGNIPHVYGCEPTKGGQAMDWTFTEEALMALVAAIGAGLFATAWYLYG
jgi:hypothetical protein